METSALTRSSTSSNTTTIHAREQYFSHGPWKKKRLSVVLNEIRQEDAASAAAAAIASSQRDSNSTTPRHMSLFDLVAVGVGGTIGSGVFVLTGFIAHHYAGPATTLSFAISGVAACCSGLCYAELAGRIPSAGSTYIYAYVSLGEWAAVVAAACLTLEYAVSGAAVARSWGDKVIEWLAVQWQWETAQHYLQNNNDQGDGSNNQHYFNPLAGLVSAASVMLLCQGVKESKAVTNFFTYTKVALVVFMTVGGFFFIDTKNFTPFAPYQAAGIFRGATSSFFGYLGYDEVCCIASEAKNPHADMPRAVLWTLGIVSVLYIFASISLTGMVPYQLISDTSGFPAAFSYCNVSWAAQITAFGEVFTLPVVVLISLLAQPRLQLALAKDGLLPPIFAKTDNHGNLLYGTLLAGIPMTLVATFVPFTYLDDLISVGILVAFSMTNTSLILLKCRPSPIILQQQPQGNNSKSYFLEFHLLCYHIMSFLTGLQCHASSSSSSTQLGQIILVLSAFVTVAIALRIHYTCPMTGSFGLSSSSSSMLPRLDSNDGLDFGPPRKYFEAPMVPLLPCAGIFTNWYLVAQLEWSGIVLLGLYVGLVTLLYLTYCRHVANDNNYNELHDGCVIYDNDVINDDNHDNSNFQRNNAPMLLREFSLPKR